MDVLRILGGLVLLVLGAEALVRGSVLLARRLRVSPLVIGLTVVAFGTSAPELVVSARAALTGAGDIALGNVVGSNIANVLLILGVAACIRPLLVESRVTRKDIPILIAVSLISWPLLADGRLGRLEATGLLLGIVAYSVQAIHEARRKAQPAVQEEYEAVLPARPGGVPGQLLLVAAGLALLALGADWLVAGAVAIAGTLGVSEALIGLTVVAAGTSLPELVTSVVAALRGESDIAVGNVVGSNLFNLLAILGTSALLRPLQTSGVSAVDTAVMVAAAMVLLPLAWTGQRLSRWEGVLLLAAYIAYVASRALLLP